MSEESKPIDINLQQAAAAARQVVNGKLQLLNLHAVLDDLAGKQNMVRELEAKNQAVREEGKKLVSALDVLKSEHVDLLAKQKAEFAKLKNSEAAELQRLTDDCRRAQSDLDRVNAEKATADEQLANVRKALAGAASTIGAA